MKAKKRLSLFALCSMTTLIFNLIINPNSASAGELNILGSTLSWNDKMYISDGCSRYDFKFNSGVLKTDNIRWLYFELNDPFGRSVTNANERNYVSFSGLWSQQICKSGFTNGLGPYIVKFIVKKLKGFSPALRV